MCLCHKRRITLQRQDHAENKATDLDPGSKLSYQSQWVLEHVNRGDCVDTVLRATSTWIYPLFVYLLFVPCRSVAQTEEAWNFRVVE